MSDKLWPDSTFFTSLGDDARQWAEAFCARQGDEELDVDVVTSWFTNAIEISYAKRIEQVRKLLG